MYWYHSEMFRENEQNVNQRLSLPPSLPLFLSLTTPSLVSVVISAHTRTRHSWTQNNV